MKKVFVLATLMFAIVSVSNAQIRFGVKAGANLSSFSNGSTIFEQVKYAPNYQFGILFQAKVFMFTIQPELLYSVKGSDLKLSNNELYDESLSNSVFRFSSQNVEVPVNIQLGLDLDQARVYIQAGPYFSYMTGGQIDGDTETFNELADNFDINNIDYGIGVGAGAELFGFQLAVRYDLGFNPIGDDNDEIIYNPFSDLKNRNFNLSLAYLF